MTPSPCTEPTLSGAAPQSFVARVDASSTAIFLALARVKCGGDVCDTEGPRSVSVRVVYEGQDVARRGFYPKYTREETSGPGCG